MAAEISDLPIRSATSITRKGRYWAEWLFLLATLLMLGSYIGYSQSKEYHRIATQQRERLANQAELIEKNLVPQLLSAKRAMDGILGDLPTRWAKKQVIEPVNPRLKLISETQVGVTVLLIANTDGKIVASSLEGLVGFDISGRDYFVRPEQLPTN